jgi:hypothetical protein
MTIPNHMKWKGLIRTSFDTAMWYYPTSNVSFFIGVLGKNQCSMDGIDVIPGTECRFITEAPGVGDLYEGDKIFGFYMEEGEREYVEGFVEFCNTNLLWMVDVEGCMHLLSSLTITQILGNIHDPKPE